MKITLHNGCSASKPSVYPKNYLTGTKELLETDWRIQYYFYDPINLSDKLYHKKLIVIKGMNDIKSLKERRAATTNLLMSEIHELKAGYNPVTGNYDPISDDSIEHNGEMPWIKALQFAITKLDIQPKTLSDMNCYVERIRKAAIANHLTHISIQDLTRRQLKQVLDYCHLSNYSYNRYLSYLGSLFRELIEDEFCDVNITRDIRRKKIIKKDREVLSDKQYNAVMDHLKTNCYEFWRYAMIFHFSGARSSELLKLKVKDVDLQNQEFKVTLLKGGRSKEVTKVILGNVLNLWSELVHGSNEDDYLIGKGLESGPSSIRPDQISRRWRLWVKNSKEIKDSKGKQMNITADFYSLKHKMLDQLDENTASLLASHTNLKTTSIYRVNQGKRDREILKNLHLKVV